MYQYKIHVRVRVYLYIGHVVCTSLLKLMLCLEVKFVWKTNDNISTDICYIYNV